MQYWQFLFFLSIFLIFYNYAGYAIIVSLFNLFRPRKKGSPPICPLPSVSFIVAAYNEEDFIEKKILNSLAQDYPAELIEFIFITDGSTDNTASIIRSYPGIRLLHQPARNGKSMAVNRAVQHASHDILVFSDANTTLNTKAVLEIARHYQDPLIGGVAGEKKVIPPLDVPDEVGSSEGMYWKYESFLKKIDSDFYSVVGAAGELFSVRKQLYHPLPGNVILDDFVASLEVAAKGYRIAYEPKAFAMEGPSFSLKDEQKRKIRISAGGFQAIGLLWRLLLFWRHPRLSFLYISHRVLRWTLSPLCLILAFIANLALCLTAADPLKYQLLLACQVIFYGTAIFAAFTPPDRRHGLLKLPYYFVFMNLSVIQGFFRFLKGSQSASWEKARRATSSISPIK
jgi:biofilm PGA synthesis N-glycosyltransferase PgaC